MKKLFISMLCISALVLVSCGNKASKKKDAVVEPKEVSAQEQYLTEDLILKMNDLITSLGDFGLVPQMRAIFDGKVELTEKEKQVKPQFLMPLEKADELITLSQKSKALGVYFVDKSYAALYGIPTEPYDAILTRLSVETDNQGILEEPDINIEINASDTKDWVVSMGNELLEKEKINQFIETAAAGVLENIYILSQDLDRYIVFFDDESASEISLRFVYLLEAANDLLPYYPELSSLITVIEPLRVINAVTVAQLKEQLTTLKGDIAKAREALLN